MTCNSKSDSKDQDNYSLYTDILWYCYADPGSTCNLNYLCGREFYSNVPLNFIDLTGKCRIHLRPSIIIRVPFSLGLRTTLWSVEIDPINGNASIFTLRCAMMSATHNKLFSCKVALELMAVERMTIATQRFLKLYPWGARNFWHQMLFWTLTVPAWVQYAASTLACMPSSGRPSRMLGRPLSKLSPSRIIRSYQAEANLFNK